MVWVKAFIISLAIICVLSEKCYDKVHKDEDGCRIHELTPNNDKIQCEFIKFFSSSFQFFFKPGETFEELKIELYTTFISITPLGSAHLKKEHLKYLDGWNNISVSSITYRKFSVNVENEKVIQFSSLSGLTVSYVKVFTLGKGSWTSRCLPKIKETPKIQEQPKVEEEFPIIDFSADEPLFDAPESLTADFIEEHCTCSCNNDEQYYKLLFITSIILTILSIVIMVLSCIIVRRKINLNDMDSDIKSIDYLSTKKKMENFEEKIFLDDHIYEELSTPKTIAQLLQSKKEEPPRYVVLPKRDPVPVKNQNHYENTPSK